MSQNLPPGMLVVRVCCVPVCVASVLVCLARGVMTISFVDPKPYTLKSVNLTYTRICMRVCFYTRICMCVFICVSVCVFMCVCAVRTHTRTCVCVCACTCVSYEAIPKIISSRAPYP
jgi:hypothetical protein